MKRRGRKPAQQATSLDVFLLAVLRQTPLSVYDLNLQSGVSIGSLIPALRRLEQLDAVESREAGPRGRRIWEITARGRKVIRQISESSLRSTTHGDLDAVLRSVAVLLEVKDRRVAIKFLDGFLSTPKRALPFPDSRPTSSVALTFRALRSVGHHKQQDAILQILETIHKGLNTPGWLKQRMDECDTTG